MLNKYCQNQIPNDLLKSWSFHQFSSFIQSCLTLCDPMDCSTPGLLVHHQLPEFTQTHVHESVMPSKYLILYCPRLFLPSIFPSIRVFSNQSVLSIRWPKYWSFSLSISPSSEYSGLISHPSTNQARPCLASEIRQDRARSWWYGRRLKQNTWQNLCSFVGGAWRGRWADGKGCVERERRKEVGGA